MTDTPASTPEASPTAAPEPATFEVVEIDAPAEAEINEGFSVAVTVRNTGGQDGTFFTDITARTPDTDPQDVGSIELNVPAGETAVWRSNEVSYSYLTKIVYHLVEPDIEFEVQLLTRVLDFGEQYRSPVDILATAGGLELKDEYAYEDYSGGTSYEEASSGNQWAFVSFSAENDSGSTEWLPLINNVALRAGNRQYDSALIYREEGEYEGGEVGPGVVRNGWIAYEIPDNLNGDDLTVEWFESDFRGDYGVRWRAGG